MELRQLRYFLSVAEHKSIRLASNYVHVTQPAISRQLQDMEREVGFNLFIRHPRGLDLTPAGETFYHDVKKLMADLDVSIENAQRIDSGFEGHLRLGFVENSSWDGVVPATLRHFQQLVPQATLELIPLNTPEQVSLIEKGNLDGGFIYEFGAQSDQCRVIKLHQHDIRLALPKTWALCDESDSVSLHRVAHLPFITSSRRIYPAYYDHLMSACHNLGVTLKIVQEEQTESAILALVSAGIGAALVNSANISRQPVGVDLIKLSDLNIMMPLSFSFLAKNNAPLLNRFLDSLHISHKALSNP
ncbi:LysR family transcriptional regulator [Tatumella morbirosei]|uniref:LysR family transcriptional regulator n=1 Tax=Tatumella morbirosei TaxID=642227 RepID=A0A095VQ25_9GAMM|nr:LysR family transcriptional regulator [Tatumella morbirosei]KGD76740.1 LysR family transcriptional regulator [Tatumella morbirosei]